MMRRYSSGEAAQVGDSIQRLDDQPGFAGVVAGGVYTVTGLTATGVYLDGGTSGIDFEPSFFKLISRKAEAKPIDPPQLKYKSGEVVQLGDEVSAGGIASIVTYEVTGICPNREQLRVRSTKGGWTYDQQNLNLFTFVSRKASPTVPVVEVPVLEVPSTPVTKPSYYAINVKGVECDTTDVIQALDLSFCLGNVLKYVVRAGKKSSDTRVEDLRKAAEYIHRELANLERLESTKRLTKDKL